DAVALTAAVGEDSVALDVPSAVAMLRPHVRERPTGVGLGVGVGAVAPAAAGDPGASAVPVAPREPVASAAPPEPVAMLTGVHHGYRTVAGGLSPVLVDLDLQLNAGERIALVGTNGAGKTTLMKLLTGLIVPRRGTVTVDGID